MFETCNNCKETKPWSDFQKRGGDRVGCRQPCKVCLSARNRSPVSVAKTPRLPYILKEGKTPLPPKELQHGERVKVPVESISILTELLNKFDCHYSLSVSKKGSRLQIHNHDMTQTYKATTPELLLSKVL